MAIDAKKALEMLTSLEEFLSARHAEELMEGEEEAEDAMPGVPHEEPDGDEGGGALVIAMRPKGAGERGGKVPGCEDCEKGIPHQHMGR